MTWHRCCFKANGDDPRPIRHPPPGPYWITTFGDDYVSVVAYVRPDQHVEEWWPEAHDVTIDVRDEITFTDRFPRPDWWAGLA